jgi:hypothetical protein
MATVTITNAKDRQFNWLRPGNYARNSSGVVKQISSMTKDSVNQAAGVTVTFTDSTTDKAGNLLLVKQGELQKLADANEAGKSVTRDSAGNYLKVGDSVTVGEGDPITIAQIIDDSFLVFADGTSNLAANVTKA